MRQLLTIAILFSGLIFTACSNDNQGSQTQQPAATPAAPITTPAPATPATANAGVEHYICPNGHIGYGGPSQGVCSQCNAALIHNQAFHNNPSTPTTPSSGAISPIMQSPGAPATTTTTTTVPTSSGQNAQGVWHYTCPSGCAGGAASQGSCSNCGAALAHNAAYHN